MIETSATCYVVTAIAFFAFAVKYALGPRPQRHHGEAARRAGLACGPESNAIFRGLYWPLAAAWLAIAVVLGCAGVVWVPRGDTVSAAVASIAAVCAGGAGALAAYRFESDLGITAPWRPAAALVILPIAGLGLLLLG